MNGHMAIRQIVFTGAAVTPARIDFSDGLNILYGASNTGKSFIVNALNFMFGGSTPLAAIEERIDYDAMWLGISMPDGKDMTLYRATSGGAFILYDGLLTSKPIDVDGNQLEAKHNAVRSNNLSQYLLKAIGLEGKVIAKNQSGEKESFTFRSIAPYMFISEETIISERSPILGSGQKIRETAEKNMFKVLLTGRDDAAVVTAIKPASQKIAREAKVEFIDEMIAQINIELGDMPLSFDDLSAKIEILDHNILALHTTLHAKQKRIDTLVQRRREITNAREIDCSHQAELALTLARFTTLDALYASDLARLEAIEEGALVLAALTVQSCAVCGAPPESQVHSQGKEEIAQYQRAAESEARKITQERRDLGLTIASLSAEADGLLKRLELLGKDLLIIEAELEQTLPLEAGIRRDYELNSVKRTELTHQLDLHEQLEVLEQKRAQLTAPQQKKKKGDMLEIGLDTNTAFKFAQTVKDVLTAWHFPDAENVQFDAEKQDIQLNGKARAANGKGVRALLHAAFKVAVLIFCRKHGLPHPGIVVLDTPLLTYREPLENAKYGELEADELAIKGTGLAQHFYEHLASLRTIGQIIILENTDPPPLSPELANIQVFVGNGKGGRAGFFPYPVQP